MKVLIVDDSAFMRSALSKMLKDDPEIEIVGTAVNGEEGLQKAQSLQPDVMTLDIEMPVLDGLSTLRRMRRELKNPPAVIICSSLTKEGSHEALKALRYGAADVIAKPGSHFSLSIADVKDELIAKIKAIAAVHKHDHAPRPELPKHIPPDLERLDPAHTSLVVIGSSTGGPPTIECLLTQLTSRFPCPIVIAQHMPPMFTKSLSERLNEICDIGVIEGKHRMPLVPATAYVAPGGFQTLIKRSPAGSMFIDVREPSDSDMFKPSVNTLFTSAAEAVGQRCAGIILTGMGSDGADGAALLKEKNAKIISQHRASCVVYGMPRAVEERGLCDAVLDVEGIAQLLGTLEPADAATRSAA